MTTDPVFHKEEAMQRVDNDLELFAELVAMFSDDWPKSVASLEDACRRQAGTEVQHLAHSIKSALGNLGGMRAYRVAFKIEIAAKSGNITEATALLESFKKEVEEFKKEAQAIKGL